MKKDKIKESVLLRAFSDIKNGENQMEDTGIVHLIMREGGILMRFNGSSSGESFQIPVRKVTFYDGKFIVESYRGSRYSVSIHESEGLWRGPKIGQIAVGYADGYLLDSTGLEEKEGSPCALEIITHRGDNKAVCPILGGFPYEMGEGTWFEIVPVSLESGEGNLLSIYIPPTRHMHRMVVERGA